MKVTRPALRYHGGKWRLAPKIIALFPRHEVYVETHAGAFSVGLRKARVGHEIYNDLSGEIVNVFRMYRDCGEELRRLVRLTPFARAEYELSFEFAEDPLEQARRTLVRSFMGHGSNSLCRSIKSGFRAKSQRSNTGAAVDWMNLPDKMPPLIERLRGVVIEQLPALEVIQRHDGPSTLFYVDPPYVISTTRCGQNSHPGYDLMMTDHDHQELAEALHGIRGAAVVSGYPSPLYEDLYAGWHRREFAVRTNGTAAHRTEVLWMNRAPDMTLPFGAADAAESALVGISPLTASKTRVS